MAKARYSTDNIGHYGLAFRHYTHFTSPIRRYPDMMVHRLLAHYLNNGKPKDKEQIETLCKHSTNMEIKATEAERASIKYKQVEFMQDKLGETYKGVISGVTNFGIFVELTDTQCEGLVSIRDLDDDFYRFDEEEYALIGQRTGRKFTLGDEVEVEVWRTNLAKKQLDFKLVGMHGRSGKPSASFKSQNQNKPKKDKVKSSRKGQQKTKSKEKRRKR
jgi:ribonuclease R